VLIAGPNLTIDRTLSIDVVRLGEVLRFTGAEITPGGKGVNVARAARRLGSDAHLVSLVPGRTGRAVADLIRDEGLRLSGVEVPGEVRSAAIVMEAGGRVTVLNEPGPEIRPTEWGVYEDRVSAEFPNHRVLVCIGSAPPGTPRDAYANLVVRARGASVTSLVDANGPLLEAALDNSPDYVVPNLAEAEGLLLGRPAESVEMSSSDAETRAMHAAASLVERGARTAIVTAGRAGVAVSGGGGTHDEGPEGSAGRTHAWIDAPRVQAVNPIGAGDSFVAGFCTAIERGGGLMTAVEEAVATGTASVEHPLAGGVDPDRVGELLVGLRGREGPHPGAATYPPEA
jgi:1-phosphofructokinase family hexose kinase